MGNLAWYSEEGERGAQSCSSVPATSFKVIISQASEYAQNNQESNLI